MTQSPVISSFSVTDWEKIQLALKTYVIHEEDRLKQINAGDTEWTDLQEYETLIKDIEMFCIGHRL